MELTLKNKYLNLATKKQICEVIKNSSIIYENGMAYIDYINLQLVTDISILQFYYDVDIDNIDMDELYEKDVVQVAKDGIKNSELDFIVNHSMSIINQEIDVYNSLPSILNRNIQTLISKIPDEKGIQKIIKSIPKTLDKVSPENLSIIKGIMDGNLDNPQLQPQPNREQRRKATKDIK